jgi:DNA-binding GntR family transcriptional regulator
MTQMLRVPREETSLRERTTRMLRSAVTDGLFLPGQKLLERELCEQLGVSRPCLRESLQHLQAEGLITVIPHKGPVVTSINAAEVRDIYAVRESLEGLAGQGFAANASEAQRLALRGKLNEMHHHLSAGDDRAILPAKNEFYDILIEGCGNVVAGQLLKQLNNRVTVLRRISMAQPGRLPQMLEELDAIVTAIEQGDGALAAELCKAHVQMAAGHVFKNLPRPAE